MGPLHEAWLLLRRLGCHIVYGAWGFKHLGSSREDGSYTAFHGQPLKPHGLTSSIILVASRCIAHQDLSKLSLDGKMAYLFI